MINRSKREETQIARIQNVHVVSYGLIFTVCLGSLAIRWESFRSIWGFPDSAENIPVFFCRLLLLLLVVFFVFQWITATIHEFNLWADWLQVTFVRSQVYMCMCALVIALGAMLAVLPNITVFAGYFSAFLLIHYWGQWLANDYFGRALAMTAVTQYNREILEAFTWYWVDVPQLGRVATMMFFSTVAFGIAFAGSLKDGPGRNKFELVAYIMLDLTILVGEFVVCFWRYKRDKKIRTLVESQVASAL